MNKINYFIILTIIITMLSGCAHFQNENMSIKINNGYTSLKINTSNINNLSNNNDFFSINTSNAQNLKIKLLPPENNQIYFGAFPDFGGPEDNVTKGRIQDFEKLVNKNITWAYFSQNWFNGITYPKDAIHIINEQGIIPFVRLMPRNDEEQFHKETIFSMENIIDGQFDNELRQWAKDAKEDNISLLIDFAVEMNGDWFSWGGYYNGESSKDKYGDPSYPDGPERYRDAYKHIIDIFRNENVTTVTWFFHPDIYSTPDEEWNQPKYYYPGDDYIDWIGVSVYGPLHPNEDYWETFSEILGNRYKSILDISQNKPIALLEFGVTDNHPLGEKDVWLKGVFESILDNEYMDFKAISYWHENWEEEDNLWATLRIDSSEKSLEIFKKYLGNKKFTNKIQWANSLNKSIINKGTEKHASQKDGWYKPKPGISWQWQLTEGLNLDYNVELYDLDLENTPQEVIDELHSRDIKVICYFNAGAYEPYRTDSDQFSREVLGKPMEGWEDEKWLDISNYQKFAGIIKSRLDLAVKKKCDGVEPDNIDAYQNDNGFDLTYDDQLRYNKWLADEAHKRNLSIALKNDLEQINDLIKYYDFAVNEQCFYYDECDYLLLFIENKKPVLNVEYELQPKDFCLKANEMQFNSLKMNYELGGGRLSCDEWN